ncbi:murein biosynthesis integral membrane protein MurJ [Helicobacter cholecystus]|uniref:Probable lipid II flippase MurJ n=1 Tax=Helicobacter cholecystus TaxID=45498 RepID=A0A3D8IXD8_9HELI|nr:murein biosynthesis integral membrane protein MurJ [Helicobacter cholecystus]RDU69231.1 murein biosynthesis integral membrane protein MurJ [Helicobacter cholecystus]VEJ24306.1 virulence factor [Helicobacter cholecystus]
MLKKAFLTNSSGILLSRILGFLRDVCMASILGAGIFSDIFFIAFKLPNLFRRIFGEGAFTQSFLPSFIYARNKGVFALSIGGVFATILLLLSLLVCLFSPLLTKLLAFGFPQDVINMAAPIVAINFWYLLLIFIVTLLGGILQYKNVFWVSAYNTALLNVCMILALLYAKDQDKLQIVYCLSYGVLCGGVAQILLHFYPLYRYGFFRLFSYSIPVIFSFIKNTHKHSQRFKKDFKSFFSQFFPALLGSSTIQLLAFIETFIASFLSFGSISYLYYANRIFQLPLALFAIATSVALFPMIAKAIKNTQTHLALKKMSQAFWFLTLTLCACSIGGIILKEEIIILLYQRGPFTQNDTLTTANVFAFYLLGLVPFGLSKILSLWLYSHKLQGKSAKYSLISLGSGTLLCLLLVKPFGVLGIAFSSSFAGFILLILNIKAIGTKNFFCIIANKKWAFITLIALPIEALAVYGLKILIQGYL